MKDDGCERSGDKGENLDDYDDIFRFEGVNKRGQECGWSYVTLCQISVQEILLVTGGIARVNYFLEQLVLYIT
jgi:hypothetical protein